MKVGIVSDGKFGDRAFEEIGKVFPTEWILVPFPGSPVVDDLELEIPDCDLYISYARHPDVALALVEKGKPVILGINLGPGFVRQAKSINEDVVAPVTMCSLEDTCWNEEINTFARRFGVPIFEIRCEGDRIASIRTSRGAPCGSTWAAAAELVGNAVSPETLRHFGLRICHHCRAPRFGRTCDKEFSGIHHIRQFIRALREVGPLSPEVEEFAEEIERLYEGRREAIAVP